MTKFKVQVTDGLGFERQTVATVDRWAYDALLAAAARNGAETITGHRAGKLFFRGIKGVLPVNPQAAFYLAFAHH